MFKVWGLVVNKVRINCVQCADLPTLKSVVVFALYINKLVIHDLLASFYNHLCTKINFKLNLLKNFLSPLSTYITITTAIYINNICNIGGQT